MSADCQGANGRRIGAAAGAATVAGRGLADAIDGAAPRCGGEGQLHRGRLAEREGEHGSACCVAAVRAVAPVRLDPAVVRLAQLRDDWSAFCGRPRRAVGRTRLPDAGTGAASTPFTAAGTRATGAATLLRPWARPAVFDDVKRLGEVFARGVDGEIVRRQLGLLAVGRINLHQPAAACSRVAGPAEPVLLHLHDATVALYRKRRRFLEQLARYVNGHSVA
jgi:hypothetical protein